MEEQGCPRCKTTKYRNPSLKLLVNVCGHSLCQSCVDLLFIKGSGVCPECGTSLRRSNFRLQVFEDSVVEKEIDIRKRILRDFNKKEENFPTLRDYNDYLEMIETIIYNLSNHIDVDATKKQIEQYKKDNKDQIKKNQSKLSRDEEYLENLIENEQYESAARKAMLTEIEKKEKKAKKKNKDALIDELMFSDMSADAIIKMHKENVEKDREEEEDMDTRTPTTAFSTGIRIGHQADFVHMVRQEQGQMYSYCPIFIETGGPEPPNVDEIYNEGYLKNIRVCTKRERAGGFRESIACHRALQDAMCGLYSFPNVTSSGS